jgi:hypothetical protein
MEVASTRMQGLLLIAITLLQVAFTTMQGIHATKHPHNDSKQNGRLDYKVTYCVFGNPLIEVHAPVNNSCGLSHPTNACSSWRGCLSCFCQ